MCGALPGWRDLARRRTLRRPFCPRTQTPGSRPFQYPQAGRERELLPPPARKVYLSNPKRSSGYAIRRSDMPEQIIIPQLKSEIATQHGKTSPPPSLLARWWIYQRERFPIFAHGVLIA